MIELTKAFTFEAAHLLPWHTGKCKNLHGHSYKLEVTVKGFLTKEGIVVDFADLKKLVKQHIIQVLDHHFLNDIIENPTAERVALWIWGELLIPIPKTLKGNQAPPPELTRVRLWETATSYVTIT